MKLNENAWRTQPGYSPDPAQPQIEPREEQIPTHGHCVACGRKQDTDEIFACKKCGKGWCVDCWHAEDVDDALSQIFLRGGVGQAMVEFYEDIGYCPLCVGVMIRRKREELEYEKSELRRALTAVYESIQHFLPTGAVEDVWRHAQMISRMYTGAEIR